MGETSSHLLRSRRFLPLFVSLFMSAANDNLFRSAVASYLTFQLGRADLAPLGVGLFLLPYLLFSATSGELSDRFEKVQLMRWVKMAEIPISALGAWALVSGHISGMLAFLFFLGAQSTFYSPLKYAVLPEILRENELIDGNAYIESGTFVAILFGTIVGGTLVMAGNGPLLVGALMMALAVGGYVASLFQPFARPSNPNVKINLNVLRETITIVKSIRQPRELFLAILGLSWFWLAGGLYLAELPAFAKDVLRADQYAFMVMLTMLSVGIGVGSVLCGRLLKGEISARYVPLAALGMTLFAFDLWLGGKSATQDPGAPLASLEVFLSRAGNWRILFDLLGFSICGGIYTVPLYALLQSRPNPAYRARAVAANNIINALFIVIAAGGATALMVADLLSISGLFLALALGSLGVTIYICRLLPAEIVKGLLATVLRRVYRVKINGLENLTAAGERALLVVNHVSFLDAALLAAFLPRKLSFAINTKVAGYWWIKPFLLMTDSFPVDPTSPLATKAMVHALRQGQTCVIFPEGRITITGGLMKIYEGPGMVAEKADAPIIPIRIDGAQHTVFSRLKGKVRRKWFPRITITLLPPCRFEVPAALKGRERRQRIGLALYDVMSAMMFETSNRRGTLFSALLDARSAHGGRGIALEDVQRKPVSRDQLVLGALVLGRRLQQEAELGEAVGVLLPNSLTAATTFFGLQAFGRVPAMLNFSSGAATVATACLTASLRTVITSRQFIERGRLDATIEALEGKARILYLEDLRQTLGWSDKLKGLLSRPFARMLHRRLGRKGDDAAVILFTSGSEGTPKGVVLSHTNILANCHQLAARVAFSPVDIAFNALPMFHAFGLSSAFLLPILGGLRCFLYPSPLHYRIVPEMIYDTNATIVFGTDTFLSGYGRAASAYDFQSIRLAVAGAERVKDETRALWTEKFGVRILEGYGATETAPVLALNTPMHYKAGTVGRLLPGITYRLEQVPGVADGQRLWVRGPNIMQGYMTLDAPGQIQPPLEGWYDTGDLVGIDSLGFVRILGRLKRFAKIGGEMVSLTKVENEICALWPAEQHAVVALPDPRKGEALVLVTEREGADRADIARYFREQGLGEIAVPKVILTVTAVPLLGSGKLDYVGAKRLALEAVVVEEEADEED